MFHSVRVRLVCWSTLVLAVLLVLFSGILYALIARHANEHFDHVLSAYARTAGEGFRGQLEENFGDVNAATAHTMVEFRPRSMYVALYQSVSGTESLLDARYYDEHSRPDIGKGRPPELSHELFGEARVADGPIFTTLDEGGPGGQRVVLLRVDDKSRRFIVLIAQAREELIAELTTIRGYFLLCSPAMLLISGVAGVWLANRSLSPVAAMTTRAEQISARNLDERLPVGDDRDELGRLATVINDLLGRLSGSFEAMREFTADASHELRTPLAIIRGEADVALSQDRNSAEYRESLATIQDEARHLSRIVDDLMVLARADAGQRSLRRESLYLNDLVEECGRKVQVLAAGKGVRLDVDPSDDLPFVGDEDLLRRMILNLLDNAIKYSDAGGEVAVRLSQEEGVLKLIVSDDGVGIPAEARALVFDRFYRLERPRARVDGGSGLGLPIVKWVAEAHAGSVAVVSRSGQGSVFTVSLPVA